MGVCDDGDKAGGADDGAAGAAGGGDIRGVQLSGGCKHVVVNLLFCMFCPDLESGFLSSLVSVASRLDSQFFAGLDSQHLRQVHRFLMACDIEESLGMRLLASIYALKANNSEKQKKTVNHFPNIAGNGYPFLFPSTR